MYKTANNEYIFSASDLMVYMNSSFASWIARGKTDKLETLQGVKKDKSPMMNLLADMGGNHEERFLNQLKAEFGSENVTEITSDKALAGQATFEALKSGKKVIFQAYLERENFAGYTDFLVRREGKSKFGNYYYEVWDTKLSKTTRPYFLIQLCCYSWMLELIQDKLPEETVIVLGDNTKDRFRISAQYSYFQSLKTQFLNMQDKFTGDIATMPNPAICSDHGAWGEYAKTLIEKSDSLALVANIQKNQINRLYDEGINTLTALATTRENNVKGISSLTFAKLKAQAAIQLRSRGLERPVYNVLKDVTGKGLSALPAAGKLDIFFDIEGHPLVDGGLEYLWGVSYHDHSAQKGKKYAFKDWWGHDQEQEKLAFEAFIDWTYQRWQNDPTMHVYHYASYEITAIKKLSTRNHSRLVEVDEMLKSGIFIDLYKIVKNGLLIGEPKYSIKNVEHLYRRRRTTDIADGGESIVFYEKWRQQGGVENWSQKNNGYQKWKVDPDKFIWATWPELKNIRDYNIDDCESTLELVDWLREQQKKAGIVYDPLFAENTEAVNETEEVEKTEGQKAAQKRREERNQHLEEWQKKLVANYEESEKLQKDPCATILVSLLYFHFRERKPSSWVWHERNSKTADELEEDNTVIHNISIINSESTEAGCLYTANYNRDQPIRPDKIANATVQGTEIKVKNIEFSEIRENVGKVSFVINSDDDHEKILQQSPLNLFGSDDPIPTTTIEERLCEITDKYFETGELSGAVSTILNQEKPGFKNTANLLLPITRLKYPNNEDYIAAIIKAAQSMDETCLCMQGPPGSGKTYTAGKIIHALVNKGKRIGVMSNSHAAIMNLLRPLVNNRDIAVAKVGGFGNKQGKFKDDYPDMKFPNFIYRTSMNFTKKQPYNSFNIVGATGFAFANDIAYKEPLDYLFVDEASQVSLANLIAASGAAKNIIMMGDQMQLEQPTQGSHPGNSGQSALGFMLNSHTVIPEEEGIFLERTYRMHPTICQPLSEVVYEGKLTSDRYNKIQAITIEQPVNVTQTTGILTITAHHEGNTQCSPEEVDIISEIVDELKTGKFTNKSGAITQITDEDILIVAPYNMQVNLLKEKLNKNLKIGTIDKFQGQEAPVVIISMSVSDVENSSRGLDFIFNINRLNVAISRAQALTIIVANNDLEKCRVTSIEQMNKVSFFCRVTSQINNL